MYINQDINDNLIIKLREENKLSYLKIANIMHCSKRTVIIRYNKSKGNCNVY